MKFLTVLFKADGTFLGTMGHERPLPDTWAPPMYHEPGESAALSSVAVHLGCAETDGSDRCCSTDLFEALLTHETSTGDAPRFGIRDLSAMPQIHDCPVLKSDFAPWLEKNGVERLHPRMRAWLTMTMPEFAAAHGLDRDITIDDMIAAESARGPFLTEEHSRLPQLQARAEKERAAAAADAEQQSALQETQDRLRAVEGLAMALEAMRARRVGEIEADHARLLEEERLRNELDAVSITLAAYPVEIDPIGHFQYTCRKTALETQLTSLEGQQ